MLDFVLQFFVNTEVADCESQKNNKLAIAVNKLLERLFENYHRPVERIAQKFRYARPEWSIHRKA